MALLLVPFALPPAVIGQLFGVNGVSSRVSMYMLVCAPGALLGNVIAGSFCQLGEKPLDQILIQQEDIQS